MNREPLFSGLIVDENDRPVSSGKIGENPCYIVDDDGFKYHVPSEEIDMQVLKTFGDQITGNEEMIAEQTAKMMGQEDLFTHAIIENQLKNLDKQFEQVLDVGLPEETRIYLGMIGFKIVINFHGEIVRIEQPTVKSGDNHDGGEN